MSASKHKSSLFSLSRIWTIATGTFTQLVRMKVFYFLAVFALLIIGVHFIELPYTVGPESIAHEKLRMIKGPSFGAMTLFAVIFAIASTALLIPRDLEERTLYTILSKPVPRLDYLLGKLLGVILVIGVSLLVMDALMCLMLWIKTQQVSAEQIELAKARGWSPDALKGALDDVNRHGVNGSLQIGVLSVFLLATVIAAIALLISTFSSSTLFTIIMTLLIYIIGLIAGGVTEYWETSSDGNPALVHCP